VSSKGELRADQKKTLAKTKKLQLLADFYSVIQNNGEAFSVIPLFLFFSLENKFQKLASNVISSVTP
jgi:hypothetical protein